MQLIPIVIGSAFLRLDAHAAATNDTPPITPTTTTPPPAPTPTPTSTPAPWGALAPGCSPAFANAASAKSSYTNCAKATGFTFDLAVAKPVVENTFCRSTACLFLYRDLKSISNDAVYCANVPGLQNVRLDTLAGPTACFGAEAASGKSDVIVRPGDKSSSGSGGSDRKPTTEPPVTTTPVPTTTEPPTAAPVTTKPSKTPKPSTKIPRTDHSGSGSDGTITTVSPAPVDNKKNSSSSGGLDQGTIIAIVLVSIGVVGVVIALIYVSTRKSKRKRSRNRSTNSGETVTHELLASYYGDPVRPSGSQMPRPSGNGGRGSLAGTMTGGRGSLRGTMSNGRGSGWHSGSDGVGTAFAGWDEELIAAVRIPYEKLTFDELLSRGGYGEVYRGTYRSEPVAIKTLLPERRRDMQQIQNFLAEVKMMANMEHERIVRFIGVAWDSLEELSVVSEFLERGDLRTVLAEFEQDGSRPHGFDEVKVKISLHVAHGLTYMHTLQPIVLHRDLKSRNILLDTELNAKITDFGVSRERSDRTMTAGVGSSLWMAPEVMMGERYDEKADIFSLGVVLSELDNHVLPYSHAIERTTGRRMPDAVILQMISQGKMRVAFSDESKSEMAQIGIKCVALVPSERPTAAEVLYMIHQVWRRYEASKTN